MPPTTVPVPASTAAQKAKKKLPRPGRKMDKKEARDYVFATYHETMALLAKH